jgi:hypothetical protein
MELVGRSKVLAATCLAFHLLKEFCRGFDVCEPKIIEPMGWKRSGWGHVGLLKVPLGTHGTLPPSLLFFSFSP